MMQEYAVKLIRAIIEIAPDGASVRRMEEMEGSLWIAKSVEFDSKPQTYRLFGKWEVLSAIKVSILNSASAVGANMITQEQAERLIRAGEEIASLKFQKGEIDSLFWKLKKPISKQDSCILNHSRAELDTEIVRVRDEVFSEVGVAE